MRRLLVLLIAGLVFLCVAGCGGHHEHPAGEHAEHPEHPTEHPK